MRRLVGSLMVGVGAVAASGLMCASVALASPAPEVPDAWLAGPAAQSAFSIEQALIHSDFKPSALSLAAAENIAEQISDEAVVSESPGVYLEDDVIILEGDNQIVTSFGNGKYGLRFDNQVQNPTAVTERVFEHFGDVYDFVVVWTTFWDYGADGLAYYVGVRNNNAGIGQPTFNNGWMWGSNPAGRLQGFINQKSINLYGDLSEDDNYAYPVMGQELTHRWLAFMKFRDDSGAISSDMLGRDQSHWSTLMHAYASVQDGNYWMDNDNGTFTLLGSMMQYSPLDLYGMGLFAPEEVEPWFLIDNATYNGQEYNGLTQFPQGITINGTRRDITIEDVQSANGPRIPTHIDSQKEFRLAYVLITRPGEAAADVWPELQSVVTFKDTFDAKFEEWSFGRGKLCSRASAACDLATVAIDASTVEEVSGDLDGMPEPGDTVRVGLTVVNDGGALAEAATITLVDDPALDLTIATPTLELPALDVGEQVTIDEAFEISLGSETPCGITATLKVELKTQDLTKFGEIAFPVGFQDLFVDDFEGADTGWVVNPDGTDTASTGGWAQVQPVGVDGGYVGVNVQTQPATAQSGQIAWITGPKGGDLGEDDIDEGTTSLISPLIDLTGVADPMVSFHSWRIGLDFNDPSGYVVAEDNDTLTTEISGDSGETWVLVDEDISNEQLWVQKTVRVLDHLDEAPTGLMVRFTARDVPPQSLSEAGIDSFQVYELQASCYGIFDDGPADPEDTLDGPGDGPDNPPTDDPSDDTAGDTTDAPTETGDDPIDRTADEDPSDRGDPLDDGQGTDEDPTDGDPGDDIVPDDGGDPMPIDGGGQSSSGCDVGHASGPGGAAPWLLVLLAGLSLVMRRRRSEA